jgi:hypothetical protein
LSRQFAGPPFVDLLLGPVALLCRFLGLGPLGLKPLGQDPLLGLNLGHSLADFGQQLLLFFVQNAPSPPAR